MISIERTFQVLRHWIRLKRPRVLFNLILVCFRIVCVNINSGILEILLQTTNLILEEGCLKICWIVDFQGFGVKFTPTLPKLIPKSSACHNHYKFLPKSLLKYFQSISRSFGKHATIIPNSFPNHTQTTLTYFVYVLRMPLFMSYIVTDICIPLSMYIHTHTCW